MSHIPVKVVFYILLLSFLNSQIDAKYKTTYRLHKINTLNQSVSTNLDNFISSGIYSSSVNNNFNQISLILLT